MRGRGAYPEDWPAIAEAVKTAAGWRCATTPVPPDLDRHLADVRDYLRLKAEAGQTIVAVRVTVETMSGTTRIDWRQPVSAAISRRPMEGDRAN